MNTKGMKFLAVLAVLAMAFAAFAVMADTDQNSAAIPEEVTTVTTEPDFRATITGDEEFNVKLGANITVNSGMTAYLVKSAGVIDFNGYTVTATGALNPVKVSDPDSWEEAADGLRSVIVNESKGLTLKDTSEKGKGGIVNAYGTATAGMAVLYNAMGGVMTVESGSYSVDNGTIKYEQVDASKSYWYTVVNRGDMTINGGYIGGMNHFKSGRSASSVIVTGSGQDEGTTLVINGGVIEYGLYVKNEANSELTINGGTIKNGLYGAIYNYDVAIINSVTLEGKYTNIGNELMVMPAGYEELQKYNRGSMYIGCDLDVTGLSNTGGTVVIDGTVSVSEKVKNTGLLSGNGEIITSGTLQGSAAVGDEPSKFMVAGTLKLTLLEGAKLPASIAFGYMDEYNDVHSFMTDKDLEVGMGDFTITAGQNKLFVDGTVTLGANTIYTTIGNVTLSGMVYSDTYTLELKNATKDKTGAPMPADIKLRTFQVTGITGTPGKVTLTTSALVEAGCSFYVAGDFAVDGILKIAEGSVVKPEGALSVGANGAIWNAGQFIATNYNDGAFDAKLIRVFMSTSYQTGTFYQGSSVYDGTTPTAVTASNDPTNNNANTETVGQTPLTVAFGSYIDMTGIDKVNLTSGGINVNSALYKYNTLILATFNNTIALTASYDNQYPVTVTLDGKSSATPVYTPKSATFRNVVWDSPMSATLYVTAPEQYTVVLAQKVAPGDNGKWIVDDDPATTEVVENVWTSGLTIKDQNGRVIPIDATTGEIKVVFGYEYTIEGANSTSNYKFFSPNGELTDLTKVSKTKGTFTMIRNNMYYPGEEEPVVLHITEGYATELTIYLDDGDKKYSVGDVFMYYNIETDSGEVVGDGTPVILQTNTDDKKVGVITGIYSNDTLVFKSEFVKFYKSTAIAMKDGKVVFPTETNNNNTPDDTTDDVVVPIPQPIPSNDWSEWKCTFDGITKTANKAFFTLKCELNYVPVTFTFGANTDDDQTITVEFTEYCSKATHTQTMTSKKVDVKAGTGPDFTYIWSFDVVVGEVYKVTWTEIDGYLSKMVYEDPNDEEQEEPVIYVKGTAMTVEGELDYLLSEQKLEYITVENNTNYDLTLTIGQFSADIPAKGSNEKVIVNESGNTMVLSKKGWTVEGWDFAITYKATPTTSKNVYVSGPQTTQTYAWYNGDGAEIQVTSDDTNRISKITITKADLTMTRYFVNVLADDHGAIDPFDQTGYMGELRKAYVTTQYGYNVVDVIYQYQEVDDPEIVEGHATKGTTPEGQEVWTYTMPASNVLLKPIIEKETRDLSFVDQNGELLAPVEKVAPRTEVFMPVPCWPLSEIIDVTTEAEIDFVYDEETGYITFVMPDEDVVFVVTCEEIDYSKNVLVTIGQRGAAIALVITALDGKMIASGSITMYVNYTYEEDGEVWTDAVEVAVEYESDGHSHGVILDETFIEELGEYYDGAFAVTGSFEFGYAAGEMSKTVYTPVLGA
jgi:hypothetical protein